MNPWRPHDLKSVTSQPENHPNHTDKTEAEIKHSPAVSVGDITEVISTGGNRTIRPI